MASKNEAKIRFTAETQDFQASLKDAKNEIKTLNSELKLNAAEMKNAGESGELLEKRHELLTQKLEANAQEQQALSDKIEVATEIYGEDSEEVAKLERQLTGAQTAQQNIEAEISNVNERMADQAAAAAENESALGRLTNTIEEQQSQLQDLQNEYMNVALEQGTDSEQAEQLAEQIRNLSTDLQENQHTLEEVTSSAQNFASGMGEADGEIDETLSGLNDMIGLAGNAGGEMTGMITGIAGAIAAGGVAGGMMAIAEGLVKITEEAINTALEFQEASATIVEGTGLIGDELDRAKQSAHEAFLEIENADATLEDAAGTTAQLITRLGLEEGSELLKATAIDMLNFSKITGEDSVNAVNMFSDVLMRWNLEVSDLPELMNEVTVANQSCDAGVSSLMNSLITYSSTWDDLGYSTSEALGQLVAWEQAGLSSDQVIRGLDKACKALAGTNETDIPGAIQTALAAVSEADNRYDGLNVTVGNTGKTISDVFGSRMSGAIVDAMQSNRVATEQWTNAIEKSKGALATTAAESSTFADKNAKEMNNAVAGLKSVWDGYNNTVEQGNKLRLKAMGVDLDAAKGTDEYSSALEKLYGSSKKASDSVEEGMEAANRAVNTGITTMQTSMSNMRWSIPRPQIPVFSLSGKFDAEAGTVPTIGVTWHAKGGIFESPTLLTSGSGRFHGVGEAGPEAIAPIDTLQDYVIDAMETVIPQIDYDLLCRKLGASVASEMSKLGTVMELNGREIGRVLREVM